MSVKKWVPWALLGAVLWGPPTALATPFSPLEVIFVSTQTAGQTATVVAGAVVGQTGTSFSGNGQVATSAISPGILGQPSGPPVSQSSSASWAIGFKVNQLADIRILLSFSGLAALAGTQYWADAQGGASVNLSVNGVTQLSGYQGNSCSTTVLTCGHATPEPGLSGLTEIVIRNAYIGSIISISGSLSANASASTGPCPYTWLCSYAVGIGVGRAAYSVTATPKPPPIDVIPEPTTWLLLSSGLIGLAALRYVKK